MPRLLGSPDPHEHAAEDPPVEDGQHERDGWDDVGSVDVVHRVHDGDHDAVAGEARQEGHGNERVADDVVDGVERLPLVELPAVQRPLDQAIGEHDNEGAHWNLQNIVGFPCRRGLK